MVFDQELGKIQFEFNSRASRIKVRILDNGLKVTLPIGSKEADAIKFIELVRSKLISAQKRLKEKVIQTGIFIDENSTLQTLTFEVKAYRTDRQTIFFSMRDEILKIEFPLNVDCKDVRNQKQFWTGISYFLKKDAKRVLPTRLKELASNHKFEYDSVKIQSSKTRWGSCSTNRSINLSFYLMLLPQHLIDYVLLHELCHTIEMNHSVKFWKLMDGVTDGKSKILRAQLKNYPMPQY
jgi:predicted metal-dependent hydrolase